jgi:hypothetical protein
MTGIFQEASPISRAGLEDIGWRIRELLGFTKERWLPVPHIIEHMLPQLYGDDFVFRVEEIADMGENHGFADPNGCELVLRADVYDGLVDGRGRDRMTAIHEMSHLILHRQNRLFRRMREEPPPAFRDPEWQAKCLAGTTMMPIRLLEGSKTVSQIVEEFGVSDIAATYRLRQIGWRLPA